MFCGGVQIREGGPNPLADMDRGGPNPLAVMDRGVQIRCDTGMIASHYLNTVQQLKGVPVRMRCDKGTENAVIGVLQQYFRWQDDDEFAGSKFFLQDRSSGNQRIEAWWSKLREGGGGWWINLFKDLRNSRNFDETRVHKECLKFCFLPLLRQELYLVAELWNTHNIQAQKRLDVHGGKPDIMYFTPEVYNSQNYLITVDVENVNACKEGLNGGGGGVQYR